METKNNLYNSPIRLLKVILEMKNFLLCTCALEGILFIAGQCQTNPLPAVPDGPWCLNANAGLRQLTTIRNASSPEFQHLPHLIFQHLIFQFTLARITPAVLWTCRVYHFPLPAVWRCSWHFFSTINTINMDMHGVSVSTTSSNDVQGVSLSTASSIDVDVQGVFVSTASSMDV